MILFPFSLSVTVHVCDSLCAFVCIALFLKFVIGFFLCLCFVLFCFYFVWFLAVLIIGGYVDCFDCSLLSLFFITFLYLVFFIFILINLFYFIFLCFSLTFLLSRVADRVLVLQAGVRPESLRWES